MKPGATSGTESAADGLVVYYIHSNMRCPTCRAIESQAQETVQADFASQLSSGEIRWKTLNYEQPAGKPLATKFDIQMPIVVLARMKAGQIQDWKRLDDVWALVGDKPAFAKYVRDEINRFIAGDKRPVPAAPIISRPVIPVPDSKTSDPVPPTQPLAIPVPE